MVEYTPRKPPTGNYNDNCLFEYKQAINKKVSQDRLNLIKF